MDKMTCRRKTPILGIIAPPDQLSVCPPAVFTNSFENVLKEKIHGNVQVNIICYTGLSRRFRMSVLVIGFVQQIT